MSAIAIACAREWAAKGARGCVACRYRLDIDKLDDHAAMLADCAVHMDSIDIVLVASGTCRIRRPAIPPSRCASSTPTRSR